MERKLIPGGREQTKESLRWDEVCNFISLETLLFRDFSVSPH
jgi:hypothetical protein